MSEFDDMRQTPESTNGSQVAGTQEMLDARIEQALQTRASQVHFKPAQRFEIMTNLPPRAIPQRSRRRVLLPAFATVTVVLVVFALVTTFIAFTQPNPPVAVTTITFTQDKVFATPQQLAMGGQPISLDPTGQHIVYGLAGQPGEMYSTDLSNPVARNQLAMRYARNVAWSPDGSALVTTIYPKDSSLPLLTLVPTGQYMHLLGEQALGASWLPSSAHTITYITESHGQFTLWEITPEGKDAHSIGTMSMPIVVQQLNWSPDSRYLALLGTQGGTPTRALLQGSSHALYLFDSQMRTLTALVAPGNSTLGDIAWSPNARLLTYEQIDARGHAMLQTLDVTTGKTLFSLTLQGSLAGMSWSPESRVLVYSDGGTLYTRVLSGTSINFTGIKGTATYPFWLDSKHILYLSIANDSGQLTRLAEQ